MTQAPLDPRQHQIHKLQQLHTKGKELNHQRLELIETIKKVEVDLGQKKQRLAELEAAVAANEAEFARAYGDMAPVKPDSVNGEGGPREPDRHRLSEEDRVPEQGQGGPGAATAAAL